MSVQKQMLDIDRFSETARSHTRDYALFHVQAHRTAAASAEASAAKQREWAAAHKAVLQTCDDANDNLRNKLTETEKVIAHNESVARIHRAHANILEGYARTVPAETRDGSGDVHFLEMAVNRFLDRFLADETVSGATVDPSKAYEAFDAMEEAHALVDSTRISNIIHKTAMVSFNGGSAILHAGLAAATPVTSGIAWLVMAFATKSSFIRDEAECEYQQRFPKAID